MRRKLYHSMKRLRTIALLSGWLIASLFGFGDQPAAVQALGPAASVSLGLSGSVLIGSSFSFTATFANTSGVATDVGYGPFVDLVFPFNGADGAAGTDTPDGVDFVSAAYLGQAVTSVVLTFPDDDGAGPGATGTVSHPYAVDNTNTPIDVTGTAGDKLVILQLPFGSFVPGQTSVNITVNATLSNLADLGTPLTIRYRGGYMFGATPLNDWCCDPAIFSDPNPDSAAWPGSPVTPTLFTFTKDNPMAEYETATGPNFPHQYDLDVDIPTGQVVTGLRITDTLPNNAAYLTGTVTATPAGFTLVDQPVAPGAQNPPNNDLVVNWPGSITGGATTSDATTDFSFFIPFTNAVGSPIVSPLTGACAPSTNTAQSSANWVPIDSRDGPTPIITNTTAPAVSACSFVGQKSVTLVTDTGGPGPTPGDVVSYTLSFQVSDFFALGGVVITDTLGDGLHFVTTTAPSLSVNGNTFIFPAAAMNAANYSVVDHWTGAPAPAPPITGATDVVFRVSDELVTRGQSTGRLLGGCVPTGGATTPDCASYNDGATTGQITFRAVIQDQFTDNFPSGDASVDHGDILNNNLLVAGAVLTTTPGFAPTGFTTTDTSAASTTIAFGVLTKSIYAINGNTAFTTTQVSPGDTVTYRIQYSMPASDFEATTLTDYLPLPIFDATTVTTYTTPITGTTPPPAGFFKFGPADTMYSTFGLIPVLTSDGTANTLTFTYPAFDDPLNRNTEVDLLFTVQVSDEPFADQLFLTNQVHANEGTTNAGTQGGDSIIQITLTEPVLLFGKAAVASDNANAVFSPTTVGPVTFNAPGTPGARWAGIINSTNLDTSPIDSDVSNVDAGDRVTFALVIENVGTSPDGAFDIGITDTLPIGFVIPAGGLNLRASFGDSAMAPISYVGLGGGPDGLPNTPDDLFGVGLQLVDNPTSGICQAHHLTNGLNIIVITYDLEISNTVQPNQVIVNTGTLGGYAGTEGGPNHLVTPLTDDATVTIASAGLLKSIAATSEAHTANVGGIERFAIGEVVRYHLVITLPEGTLPNLQARDNLPAGLTFLNDNTAKVAFVSSVSGSITSTTINTSLPGCAGLNFVGASGAVTPTCPLPDTAVSNSSTTNTDTYNTGTDPFLKVGDVLNGDSDADVELVVLEFNALVDNTATGSNDAGDNRNNTFNTFINGVLTGLTSNTVNGRISEPSIAVNASTKTALPTTGDASDVITYTVIYTTANGANNTTAFDLVLTDTLPAGVVLNPASLTTTSACATGVVSAEVGNSVTVTVGTTPVNCGMTIRYTGTLQSSVIPGQVFTNTATLAYTSLPGPNGTVGNPTGSTTPGTPGSGAGERDGSGGTINDYRGSDIATVTVPGPTTGKGIVGTNQAHTAGNSVAIGEIVTYSVAVTLPEGITSNGAGGVTIVDTLDSGLAFVDCLSVTASASVSTDLVGGLAAACNDGTLAGVSNPLIGNSGGIITFTLGTLTNSDSDNALAETLNLTYTVVVLNSPGNDRGVQRNNNAAFNWNSGAPQTVTASAPNVILVEPTLILDKGVTPAGGDAGDVVTFTLRITNTAPSNTAAFEVALTDVVPAGMTYVPGSLVNVAGLAATLDDASAPTLSAAWASLAVGQNSTLQFRAILNGTVAPGDTITNTANVRWTSLPGDVTTTQTPYNLVGTERTGDATNPGGPENDYTTNDSASLTITGEGFSKALESTSASFTANTDVTIGEVVTYTLAITLPEGATPSLVVVDNLPAGLGYVSGSGVLDATGFNGAVPAPVITTLGGSGDDVTFTFGAITVANDNDPTNNSFRVRLQARVLDVPGNVGFNPPGQTPLPNAATLQAGSAPIVTSEIITTTVVEPQMVITKTLTPDQAAANDTITVTLAVQNSGASTAFDVIVEDALPDAKLTNITNLGNPAGFTFSTIPSAGFTIVRYTGGDILVGNTAVFTLTAQVTANVTAGEILTNTAIVTQTTTLPGADSNERDEPPVSGIDTLTITAPDISLVKDDLQLVAVPGQTVVYTLTVSNVGQRDATGVVITDVVSTNTTFNAGASSAGWTCLPNGNPGSLCTYVVGNLSAGGSAIALFAVTVDNPLPAGVVTLDNAASASDDGAHGLDPNPVNNGDDDVDTLNAAPDLQIVKSDGGISVSAGGVIPYALTYANVGNQDATGVVITETVPAETTFTLGASSLGWACADGAPAGALCTFTVGGLAANTGGVVTFAVTVDNPLLGNVTQIINTVSLGDDGSNGSDPTPGDNTDIEITPITPPTAVELLYFRVDGVSGLNVTLAWATASEIDNYGFKLYRAPVNDFAVAEFIHFEPSAVPGGGGPGAAYSYVDTVSEAGQWWYWLGDVDTYGVEVIHQLSVQAMVWQPGRLIYLPILSTD